MRIDWLPLEVLHQIMDYAAPTFYAWLCNRYIYHNALQSNNSYLLFKMIRYPTNPLLLPSSNFLLDSKCTSPFHYLFYSNCLDSYFRLLFAQYLKSKKTLQLSCHHQNTLLQFVMQKNITIDLDLLSFCIPILSEWTPFIRNALLLFSLLQEMKNIPLLNEQLIQCNRISSLKYKSNTLNQLCNSVFEKLVSHNSLQIVLALDCNFFLRVARIKIDLIPLHCIPFDYFFDLYFCKELCKRNVQYAQYFDQSLLQKEDNFYQVYSHVKYYKLIDFISCKWKFLQNKSLVMECCKIDALLFQYLPLHFKEDLDIILVALQQNGIIIQYLSPHDKEKVCKNYLTMILLSNPMALEYIPEQFKEDKIIMKKVLRKNGNAYRFLSKRLQQDREMILLGVKYGIETVKWMDYKLKSDLNLMKKLLQTNIFSFVYFPAQFKDNIEIAKLIAQSNLHCNQISYCTPKIKQQSSIMKKCFSNFCTMNFHVFELEENQFALQKVICDEELLTLAIKNNPQNLTWLIQHVPVSSKNRENWRHWIKVAIHKDGSSIQYVNKQLQHLLFDKREWKHLKSVAFQNDPRILFDGQL